MPVNTLGFQNAVGEIAVSIRRRTDQVEAKERLARRLDGYRRHHMNSLNQFDNYMNSVYEQQRIDTRLLHQNWVESRAKKVGKSKLTRNGQNSTGSSAQKLLKQKLDAQSNLPLTSSVNSQLKMSSPLPPTSHEPVVEVPTSAPANASEPLHRVQTSIGLGTTALTTNQNVFSSAIQNMKPHNTLEVKVNSADALESCKLETKDVQSNYPLMPDSSPVSGTETGLQLGDLEGLPDFILDDDFMQSLDFDTNFSQDAKLQDNSSSEMFSCAEERVRTKPSDAVSCGGDLLAPSTCVDSGFVADIGGDMTISNTLQGTAPVTPMARIPMEPCLAGAAPPTPSLLGDTGPAAETLKQMAAQHQNQGHGQFVSNPSRFVQDVFPGRYQTSAACYMDRGFMQQDYGLAVKNGFAGRLNSGMPQQHAGISTNAQLQSASEYSSMYYLQGPQGQMQQHFQDGATVSSSSLQQLEHQVLSHFDSQEHCDPTHPHLPPAVLQSRGVHSGAPMGIRFHVSQRPHATMQCQQQMINMNPDCHSYSMVDDDVADQVHRLYQSRHQQQQQQQCFNPYRNAASYQFPTMYHDASVNGNHVRFAAAPSHQLSDVAVGQISEPSMIEQVRYDAYATPKSMPPTPGSVHGGRNAQMVPLVNDRSSSAMPRTLMAYAQPRTTDDQYQNMMLNSDHMMPVVGLNMMGQGLRSSANWSSIEQQQLVGQQYEHNGDPTSRCRNGGNSVLPSYDELKYRVQQQTVCSTDPCSVMYGDQDFLNHGWTPSVQLHHGIGLTGSKAMHVVDDTQSRSRLPQSCSGNFAPGRPMVANVGRHSAQYQDFEFLQSLETAATDGREQVPQNILDGLPTIF